MNERSIAIVRLEMTGGVGAHHQGNTNILWADMHVAPMLKVDFMLSSTLIDIDFLYPEVR